MGLPLLITFAGLASIRPSLLRQAVEKRPLALLLVLALTAWACASLAWSQHDKPDTALKLAVLIPVSLMFAAAAGADARAARLTSAAGVAAFVVLATLLAVEALFGLPLNRAVQPGLEFGDLNRNTSRGVTVLLALAWPAAAWFIAGRGAWRWGAAAAVFVAMALLGPAFGQDAILVAFVLGVIVFCAALIAPRLAVLASSGAMAFWMLAAPFLTPVIVGLPGVADAVPESWAQRIGIWRYVCAEILERPVFGGGLDLSRAVTEHIVVRGVEFRAVKGHPHSASLQIWFETGAVGAVLAAAGIALGGWVLARSFADNRPAAAATAASFAALGVVANVSFSIWQEWWLAAIFVAAALVTALRFTSARA